MKKAIIIGVLLSIVLYQAKALPPTQKEQQLCDSIFRVANTMEADTLRIQFLRDMFQRYIGTAWSIELLDSALVLCLKTDAHKEEVATLFDFYRHYQSRGDVPNAERYFRALKAPCYRSQMYGFYFNAWTSILEFKCAQGDTEYALIESRRMLIEAVRLNYPHGIPIAKLTLARTLKFARRNEEAVRAYRQVLDYQEITPNMRITVYGELSDTYYIEKKYQKAIVELRLERAVIDEVLNANPEYLYKYKNRLLETELAFCSIYSEMEGEEENLKRHLDEAKKYYSESSFIGYYIRYHSCWGLYYSRTKEWELCFREFEIALAAFKGMQQPWFENSVRKMKAEATLTAGRWEEAEELFQSVVTTADSLNRDILRRHKEIHQANYKIQKALSNKEERLKQRRQIIVGTSLIVLLILIIVIARTFHLQRLLCRSEKETREALALMKATDKLKELFLKNITYEIRIPLNAVVGFSDLLSTEKGLTAEEKEEYSAIIKSNAGKLLSIINNVLDLSRLESGMMCFNVQTCDAVQLCRDAEMMIKMQESHSGKLRLKTELDSLPIQADSKWLMRVLTSVLSARKGDEMPCPTECVLTQENLNLKITIVGSPLCNLTDDEQEQRILHDINQVYLESFNGTYQLLEEKGKKVIVITYPL